MSNAEKGLNYVYKDKESQKQRAELCEKGFMVTMNICSLKHVKGKKRKVKGGEIVSVV